MKKYSLGALVAAGLLVGGLTAGSASAADLGGDCCADLEERIAELEATTARKGNRKVSLTISGWVAEQVMYWDDDYTGESNVYVGGIGTTIGTHFKMTGEASIAPGWSAGYVLHVEADGSDALLGIDQWTANGNGLLTGTPGVADSGNTNYVQLLQSFWFIKSDTLGKISVGKQSQASDNTAILVDGSGSLIPANYVQFDYGGFETTFGQSWFDLAGCSDCNGAPTNSVRYDSPTFGGFSVSASWGEDDFWDVAARYAGEWAGFKVSAAAAYSEATDSSPNTNLLQADDTEFFQVGGYVQHVATGLFAYGAYGRLEDMVTGDELNDFWYVKGGVRERWTPLGHTVLYGEYQDFDNTANDSEVQLWGAGVVQEIDAAAMSVWLSYRHLEGEDGGVDVDDFQYVKAGALINF
jgi:predicted porin